MAVGGNETNENQSHVYMIKVFKFCKLLAIAKKSIAVLNSIS